MTAINSSQPVDLNKLHLLSTINKRQLDEIVRSKVDHLKSAICANGMGLQQIRSKKIIPDENLSGEYVQKVNGIAMAACSVSGNEEFRSVYKRGYLLGATRLFNSCLSFWMNVQSLLAEDSKPFDSSSLSSVSAVADELDQTVFKQKEFESQIYMPSRNTHCKIHTMRLPGVPPVSSFETEVKLEYNCISSSQAEYLQEAMLKWFRASNSTVLVVVLYKNDPTGQEYIFHPTNLSVLLPKENCIGGFVKGILEPTTHKLVALFELFAKKTEQFSRIVEEEKKAISDAMLKLKARVELNQQLAAIPAHTPKLVPKPSAVSSTSYIPDASIQKPKKGKKVEPAVDSIDDDEIVESKPAAKIIERAEVVISDPDAYNTFRLVMGEGTGHVSWNEVVQALKQIGFEVTQGSGSNTWKFKWKTQAWLRDEKTIDEIADEGEETTVAATSMHFPHQGGLSARSKLDHGRLSSFRSLLEESGFDIDSVTLKRKP